MTGLLNNKFSMKRMLVIFIFSLFIINSLQGQNSIKDESFKINKNIILDYFGVDLKTTYKKAEKIIKDSELAIYTKTNEYIRIFGKLSGIEKIKYTDLYFTDGVLTNIVVYIDRDSSYMDSIYNNLKNAIDINYNDQTKETATWTNGNITLELKMENTGQDKYKMISLHYYSNNYKKNIENESDPRAVSISIGGGLGIGQSISSYYYTQSLYGYGSHIIIPLVFSELSIPFNFTYYPNIYFGIGFNFNIGAKVESYPGFNNTLFFNIYIINNFMVSNKFGLMNKSYFLLEYGGDFIPRFNIIYKPLFFAGPSIFMGYEFVTKKGFAFTAGNKLGLSFAQNPDENDVYNGNVWRIMNFTIDFQLRFRFQYFKYLKDR